MLANNNLQILNINKSDEGIYRCEGRVEARGEIDFRDIIVIVNGKHRIIYTYCCISAIFLLKGQPCKLSIQNFSNKPPLYLEEISPLQQHQLHCISASRAVSLTYLT